MPDDTIRADVLEILGDALGWELPAAHWDGVADLAGAMAAAYERGDAAAVDAAVEALDLLGPDRMHRLGDVPVVPPPPKVREFVNHLVHRITEDADE
ncbi:CATRA system-associated protein [Herbidospora cretacea]|uniref:CATRA system-associated protein n=1 Tax=Herbidospora cretacea TaxID=28444 RepID=UPI00077436F3|nr:CATRA system-associated protein [Herbidospora cretacea]